MKNIDKFRLLKATIGYSTDPTVVKQAWEILESHSIKADGFDKLVDAFAEMEKKSDVSRAISDFNRNYVSS